LIREFEFVIQNNLFGNRFRGKNQKYTMKIHEKKCIFFIYKCLFLFIIYTKEKELIIIHLIFFFLFIYLIF
jgi:hypothetical protein